MTAINVIKQSNAVHVLTDGAGYNADGTLIAIANKVWPVAHLNLVLASRGSAYFAPLLAQHASAAAHSFDHLKSIMPALALELAGRFAPLMRMSELGSQFDLVVAGWSETSGPSSYFLCDHHQHGPSVEPWKPVDLGPISLLPQTAAMKVDLDHEFPNGADPDQFDSVKDGMCILEIQRRHPSEHGPAGSHMLRGVGMFAQLTRGAIETKIIHRWPDEIGKPIKP